MIPGASKNENELLLKMGIVDVDSLLEHLPRRYEDFSLTEKEKLFHLAPWEKAVVVGQLASPVKQYRFAKASKCMFYFHTSYGFDVQVQAWNRPYLGKTLFGSDTYTLQLSYDEKGHCFNLITLKKGDIRGFLLPVYSLPNAFPEHRFIRLVKAALEGQVLEFVPEVLRIKYRLPTRKEALSLCHFPKDKDDLAKGYRYLKYEEALLFCLKNQVHRVQGQTLRKTNWPKIRREMVDTYFRTIGIFPTKDQLRATWECLDDMDSPIPMNRLLQGDVGTGKTFVASALILASFTRGKQSALMAPTEALARQHKATLDRFYQGKLQVALLLGSTKAAERKKILAGVKDGTVDCLVGTHALFSKDVAFASLGLVLIDEQHKFGVNQRTLLLGKGEEADLLLLSATPIPRTLAKTLYGDMDVSTLEVFPNAKRQVKTVIVPPKAPVIKKSIDKALSQGRQVYAVAPQIEDKEAPGFTSAKKLFDGFAKVYGEEVGLLHGKMSSESKEAALSAFASGQKKILVSTSVIEVGIDVPSAALLLVYAPTHFSLSSLHQLRGRVGRDGRPAACLLIASPDEEGMDKLEVLVNTDDGFEVSKADLSRRGFGEMFGYRQSGFADLKFASVVDDYKMFQVASEDAKWILEHPSLPGHGYLIARAKRESVDRG